jgi:hypothetical protein
LANLPQNIAAAFANCRLASADFWPRLEQHLAYLDSPATIDPAATLDPSPTEESRS